MSTSLGNNLFVHADPPEESLDDLFAPEDLGPDDALSKPATLDADEIARLERKRLDEAARLEKVRAEHQQVDDTLGKQRRQNVRVSVRLPLEVRIAGHEEVCRTRDVSATGIGFSTRLPIELEQHGEAVVSFSGWTFRKEFVVRFVKPILAGCQVGVQFDDLTDDERERLVKQVFDVQRAQLDARRRGGAAD